MTASRARGGLNRSNTLTALGFLLPNVVGFVAFTLLPLVAAFLLAFAEWDTANPIVFVGLKNFQRLFKDETFKISLLNTIYYTVATVPLTMICSLAIAVVLNQRIRALRFFRSAFFFPYVVSMVAVAVVWNMLLHPTMGPVNNFLSFLGMMKPPGWTASTEWAMPAVIMASVWRQTGFFMVIYLAGLQGIPRSLYEAAEIDGAGIWNRFRNVTLPGLTSVTFFVSVMLVINGFKIFDLIMVMTEGGPGRATNVLVYHIYYTAFMSFRFGYASAISMVLLVIVLAVTIAQFRLQNKLGESA
jgi:multiple sugar transport system permease protein